MGAYHIDSAALFHILMQNANEQNAATPAVK